MNAILNILEDNGIEIERRTSQEDIGLECSYIKIKGTDLETYGYGEKDLRNAVHEMLLAFAIACIKDQIKVEETSERFSNYLNVIIEQQDNELDAMIEGLK